MGIYGFFLFSEEIAQLEAFKATLTDPAEIADVDKTIALLKAKEAEKKGE
jgi:hypothetical protein